MRRKLSDLNPPLGKPGGPCQVIQRIEEEVSNPRLERQLVTNIERGFGLSNPEAAVVYDVETETGLGGLFKQLVIGPHAQYRMDLRSVTVYQVLVTLKKFFKLFGDAKSRRDGQYLFWERGLSEDREGVNWVDPQTGLALVFRWDRSPGRVKLITTYWKGEADPKMRPGECKLGRYTPPMADLTGWKTFVPETDGTQPGVKNTDKQVSPSPPWTGRSLNIGPTSFNVPGTAEDSNDGKSISKDKVRTLSTPGEDYDTSTVEWSPYPTKRHLAYLWLKRSFWLWERPEVDNIPEEQKRDIAKAPEMPNEKAPMSPGFDVDMSQRVYDNPGSARVIPWNSDMVNNKAAALITQIQNRCDVKLKAQAKSLSPTMTRADTKNLKWIFKVPGSKGDTYTVHLKAEAKGNTSKLSKMDVKVSCTCPYWQWKGPEHWASVGGYLFGKPRGTASKPDKADPEGTHGACKHVLAVLDMITPWVIIFPKRKKKTAASRLVERYFSNLGWRD